MSEKQAPERRLDPSAAGGPSPIAVAFLWHFHQPDYREPREVRTDDGPETAILPWVRLHASRAYFDLAWLHHRHPDLRSTVNFVPILVEQLQAFVAGARDRYWAVSHKPARDLTQADRAFIVERFFALHHAHGVQSRPRYASLLERQARGADAFDIDDLRDLQVLFNLAWFGFGARVEYPFLAEMEQKGHGFREDEKRKVLDLQVAVARRILPLWRALAARGQVELTTTPYAHPILPLIIDTDAMADCQPRDPRPPRFAFPDDAAWHVEQAVAHHAAWVGQAPTGCWPAEGAVGNDTAALLAEHGLRWMATDEAQLFRALPPGSPRRALYQPWRLQTGGTALDVVFRDRTLSDLIGFTYARNPAESAVGDLLARVRAAGTLPGTAPQRPPLVLIALDGENPWETYPESGRAFLETLANALTRAPDLASVCLTAHLAAHPPVATLPRLPAGSWINGDFRIWIGDPTDNTAWRLLGDARRALSQEHADSSARLDSAFQTSPAQVSAHLNALTRARRHLLIAEGSDWFWWYGEPFRGSHKDDFDHLFRARLRAAWRALDLPIPEALHHPLEARAAPPPQAVPDRFLHPRFAPGDSTWFEWSGAGVHALLAAGTAMHAGTGWFVRLLYGFDSEYAYFRLEPATGADFTDLSLRLRIAGHLVDLPLADGPVTLAPLTPEGTAGATEPLDRVKRYHGTIELGVPFAALGLAPGDALTAAFRLLRGEIDLARYPAQGEVHFQVPGADFEAARWTA